jgi:hypothetical protein
LLDTPRRDPYTNKDMPKTALSRTGPAFWWGLSALVLAAGYADLVRGGITLAPILLVLGYCVLIPIAILKR